MKWLTRILALGLLVLLGWWLWQKFVVTDEQRVRRAIANMEKADEKMSFLSLEGYIATDYHDDRELDKSSLLMAVRATRMQYSSFFIHLSDETVTIEPDHQTAAAVFIAKVLATPRDGGSESELFEERFRLFFRKTDQGWKLTGSEVPKLSFE
jgi:hypothetical protein